MREALVMAEVQIGLCSIGKNINLAVLEGAHRAGIHIEVGVELLKRHLESTPLQNRSEGCRRQAFSKRTHHAAGHENRLHGAGA